jgi:hypothetical protein
MSISILCESQLILRIALPSLLPPTAQINVPADWLATCQDLKSWLLAFEVRTLVDSVQASSAERV